MGYNAQSLVWRNFDWRTSNKGIVPDALDSRDEDDNKSDYSMDTDKENGNINYALNEPIWATQGTHCIKPVKETW